MLPLAPLSPIAFFPAAAFDGARPAAPGPAPIASEYHIPAVSETPDPRVRRALA